MVDNTPLPPAISDRRALLAWAKELREGQPPSTVPAFRGDLAEAMLPIRPPHEATEAPTPLAFVDAWPYFPEPVPATDGVQRIDGATNFATVILAGPRAKAPTPTGQRIFGVLICKRPKAPRGTRAGTATAASNPASPYTRFALVAWDWKGGIWSGELNTAKGGINGNVSIRLSRRATDIRPQWFGPWFMRPAGMQQARRGPGGIISRPDNEPV